MNRRLVKIRTMQKIRVIRMFIITNGYVKIRLDLHVINFQMPLFNVGPLAEIAPTNRHCLMQLTLNWTEVFLKFKMRLHSKENGRRCRFCTNQERRVYTRTNSQGEMLLVVGETMRKRTAAEGHLPALTQAFSR